MHRTSIWMKIGYVTLRGHPIEPIVYSDGMGRSLNRLREERLTSQQQIHPG
jgi:hypothetical protein